MTDHPKPAIFVGLTHHDEISRGSPITGVDFDASFGGIQASISFLDIPPIAESAAMERFRTLLRDLGNALLDACGNPHRLYWNGRAQELMPTNVRFQGSGPFSVAPAQSASARALSSTVEMTLYAIVGNDPKPRPIAIQMTHGVANKLGHELVTAAVDVESQAA
jgi:hypothetical protein